MRYVIVDDGSRDRSAEIVAGRHRTRACPRSSCGLSRNFGHQAAVQRRPRSRDGRRGRGDRRRPAGPAGDHPRDDRPLARGLRRRLRACGSGGRRTCSSVARLLALLPPGGAPLRPLGPARRRGLLPDGPARRAPPCARSRRRCASPACCAPGSASARRASPTTARSGRRGHTKYTLGRLYRLATDGVVSSSVRPLQLAQVFSFSYLVLIVRASRLVVLRRLVFSDEPGLSPSLAPHRTS